MPTATEVLAHVARRCLRQRFQCTYAWHTSRLHLTYRYFNLYSLVAHELFSTSVPLIFQIRTCVNNMIMLAFRVNVFVT